jgi:hypothetical protein
MMNYRLVAEEDYQRVIDFLVTINAKEVAAAIDKSPKMAAVGHISSKNLSFVLEGSWATIQKRPAPVNQLFYTQV